MIWYLNSKLDLNLSCAKEFRNLNSMVTWCINWRRLLALIFFQIGYNMYCNRLHAWLSAQSRVAILLSSLIARRWIGLQTLWRLWLKDLSIDEIVGAWCFGCLSGPPGFPVWFLLLWYSVVFTAESLSLLYLLVIFWFICSRRWCINKLGVFHANCLDPHLN